MNGIWIDQQAAATLLPSACDDARPTAIGERADTRRARVPCHAQAAASATSVVAHVAGRPATPHR